MGPGWKLEHPRSVHHEAELSRLEVAAPLCPCMRPEFTATSPQAEALNGTHWCPALKVVGQRPDVDSKGYRGEETG
jgi:hypothetical protein